MVVQLPLTPVQSHFQVLSVPFDAAMQLSYRQAVADASGLSLDNIQIRSITAVTDGVAVETLILAQVVPLSLTTNNLNGHLVALGLPPAVLLTPPVLKLFPIISEGAALMRLGVGCAPGGAGPKVRVRFAPSQKLV